MPKRDLNHNQNCDFMLLESKEGPDPKLQLQISPIAYHTNLIFQENPKTQPIEEIYKEKDGLGTSRRWYLRWMLISPL